MSQVTGWLSHRIQIQILFLFIVVDAERPAFPFPGRSQKAFCVFKETWYLETACQRRGLSRGENKKNDLQLLLH